jgi:predicted Zn-dependent protease with MMP-like domain
VVIEVEPGRFEEMVATALDELPAEFGRLMSNVAVTVEHGRGRPGLLGLYEGIPLTSRTTTQYTGVLPDRITIYRQAICAICHSEQEVADQVRRTVIHEVGHHFGIDDDRLSELGWLGVFRPGRPGRQPPVLNCLTCLHLSGQVRIGSRMSQAGQVRSPVPRPRPLRGITRHHVAQHSVPQRLVDRRRAQPLVAGEPSRVLRQVTQVVDHRSDHGISRRPVHPCDSLPLTHRPLPQRAVHPAVPSGRGKPARTPLGPHRLPDLGLPRQDELGERQERGDSLGRREIRQRRARLPLVPLDAL